MDGYPLTRRRVIGRFAQANTAKNRSDRVTASALELTDGWPAPTLRRSIDRLLEEPGIAGHWKHDGWSFPAAIFVRIEASNLVQKDAAE